MARCGGLAGADDLPGRTAPAAASPPAAARDLGADRGLDDLRHGDRIGHSAGDLGPGTAPLGAPGRGSRRRVEAGAAALGDGLGHWHRAGAHARSAAGALRPLVGVEPRRPGRADALRVVRERDAARGPRQARGVGRRPASRGQRVLADGATGLRPRAGRCPPPAAPRAGRWHRSLGALAGGGAGGRRLDAIVSVVRARAPGVCVGRRCAGRTRRDLGDPHASGGGARALGAPGSRRGALFLEMSSSNGSRWWTRAALRWREHVASRPWTRVGWASLLARTSSTSLA